MEPKKNLKKHKLVESKWDILQEELISRINEAAQIHRNTTTGPANWVIVGSDAAEMLNDVLNDYSIIVTGDTWTEI